MVFGQIKVGHRKTFELGTFIFWVIGNKFAISHSVIDSEKFKAYFKTKMSSFVLFSYLNLLENFVLLRIKFFNFGTKVDRAFLTFFAVKSIAFRTGRWRTLPTWQDNRLVVNAISQPYRFIVSIYCHMIMLPWGHDHFITMMPWPKNLLFYKPSWQDSRLIFHAISQPYRSIV